MWKQLFYEIVLPLVGAIVVAIIIVGTFEFFFG